MLSYNYDGCIAKGYIRPVPGLHDGLRFDFRPVLVEEHDALTVLMSKTAPLDGSKLMAREICKRIKRWSLTDHTGAPVPVLPENVLRLQRKLFLRVCEIVMGAEASDVDTEANDDAASSDDYLRRQALAVLEGAGSAVERDLKN